MIGSSVKEAVEQFLHEKLVSEEDLPAFNAAVRQSMRWKESAWAEVILIVVIVASMVAHLDIVKSTHLSTWILVPTQRGIGRSLAGWWLTTANLSGNSNSRLSSIFCW